MCRFLETILCVDGNFQNLKYHQQRVDSVFTKYFQGTVPFDLSERIIVPVEYSIGTFRIRIVYNFDLVTIEYFPVLPRFFQSFILIADNAIEYECKYEDRTSLNAISALKSGSDEAIIVKNGCITDTTISNLVFFDGINWFTPNTPLLEGTMRRQLLEKGICTERRITVRDLPNYRSLLMINALLGFNPNNASLIHSIVNLDSFCS